VDLAMDLITGQETLMDLVIIMVQEITTDQDLTMVQDQVTDHQKAAVLVLLNLNSFKKNKKIALITRAVFFIATQLVYIPNYLIKGLVK
jgi:hypothetical protein